MSKRRNFPPFVYAVDQRDGHLCDMESCEEPVAYSIMLRLKDNSDPDIGLCVPHFVALRQMVNKPHGEESPA